MRKSFNQSGSLAFRREAGIIHTLPLLIIIAAVGIISFLLISATLPLNGLFGVINPKTQSEAAATPAPAQAYQESAGQVVFEAENFSQNIPRSSHQWNVVSGPLSNFTGASYLEASPDNGMNNDAVGYSTLSPELQYPINFATTGTYYVWIRGRGIDPSSDSLNVGLDGMEIDTANRIGNLSPNLFEWLSNTTDGPKATIQVTTTGTHIFNVWMREDGFKLDKILLTTDPSTNFSFVPTGVGPPESPKSAAGPTPAPTPTKTPSPSCPKANLGDLDCDGDIDIFDYSILVTNFGRTGTGLQGDLDHDGDIDIFDYSILVTNFGH